MNIQLMAHACLIMLMDYHLQSKPEPFYCCNYCSASAIANPLWQDFSSGGDVLDDGKYCSSRDSRALLKLANSVLE